MANIRILYGSTMGGTEAAAQILATSLNAEALPITAATVESFNTGSGPGEALDLLLLGSSTWGYGELQEDWASALPLLEAADLTGVKVAVFGTGDQIGFSDTYVNAIATLADIAVARGATLIGQTSAAGYQHSASLADRDGVFVGLALDDLNEPEKTPERLSAWVEQLKASL